MHHFVEGLTPACTFCTGETETIMHLFWECRAVEPFIEVATENILNEFPIFGGNYNMKSFIFGIRNEPIYSAQNLFLLLIKKFIWNSRCKKALPEYITFQCWFKKEIRLKKACYDQDKNLDYLAGLAV